MNLHARHTTSDNKIYGNNLVQAKDRMLPRLQATDVWPSAIVMLLFDILR